MSNDGQPASPPKRRGRPKGGGSPATPDGSTQARRIAAAVLEVLAGVRSPSEAATALGVSPTRYYALEQQALGGLVAACEPKPRGRQFDVRAEAERLGQEKAQLEREVARLSALLRQAQRAVGLQAAPAKGSADSRGRQTKTGKPRKRRKPTVRALSLAERLRLDEGPDAGPPS